MTAHDQGRVLAAVEVASDATTPAIQQISTLVLPNNALANVCIERGLRTNPGHLGLLHFMIHNMEQNPSPGSADGVATQLYNTGGAQGHTQHMATHIDQRTGL